MKKTYPYCDPNLQPLIMLEVDRKKVLKEVATKTAYIAAKTVEKPEEDGYDRVSVVDEDEGELEHFWDECHSELVYTLASRYITDGMNDEVPDVPDMPPHPFCPCPPPPPIDDNEANNTDEEPSELADNTEQEQQDIYKIVLRVWPGFNHAIIKVMERGLYLYFVNSIVAKWCMLVHHADAEMYAATAEVQLAEVQTKLVRKTFIRPSHPW